MKTKATEDYKAISLWWSGDIDSINRQQLQIYARIDFADNMIRKYGSGKSTAEQMVKKFEPENPHYTIRQAYIDMDWAIELQNSMSRKSKEMDKLYAISLLKTEIKRVVEKVTKPEQRATIIARLLKELRETIGYDQQDLDLPNFDDMGGNTYVITTNPEDVGIKKVNISDELIEKYRLPKDALYKLGETAEDVTIND